MDYNEPDNKTTQIPSFLRGTESANLVKKTDKQLEKPKFDQVEKPTVEEVPEKKVPAAPKASKKVNKEKLPKSVRVMCYIVAAVFVLYVGVNVFWAVTGGPKVADPSTKPDESAQVEESTAPTSVPTTVPVETVVPQVQPEETDVSRTGTLIVLAETITKRTEPSLNASDAGAVYTGEKYAVSAVQEADGYTWYQIDDGTWIASDGSWVEYTTN